MAKSKVIRSLMAGGVAAAVGLCSLAGASPASAYIGTGGGGTGGSGGADTSHFILVTGDDYTKKDKPFQGWERILSPIG